MHKAEEVNENCLELQWIDRRWIVAINVLLYWKRYIYIYAKRPFNFNRSAFVSFQLLYETSQSKLQLQTSKSFFSLISSTEPSPQEMIASQFTFHACKSTVSYAADCSGWHANFLFNCFSSVSCFYSKGNDSVFKSITTSLKSRQVEGTTLRERCWQ